ncbi:prepilin-type N-terminal cleavage/methylation domain-containing protein [Fluviispira vulneris]|uniref:prepilin-type N-terminal cleavage/methylation domain-containing protein n=1 Tax=Fluviispira vulneris TaxID=2763012 RepID=UPI001648B66C|nr:prepilin-type N-terminal cleavage/methylation domain-containing protein [Fluviispira vulneris]
MFSKKKPFSLFAKNKVLADSGFTLIEIIIVLGIIGAIAGVILPNLTLSIDSQMSSSLRNFTAQVRSAYNSAIFSGRLHRMVIDIKKSEYWVEQAPLGFEGRPPAIDNVDESDSLLKSDRRKRLLESLDDKAKQQMNREMTTSSSSNKKFYSIRSIPVVQREILRPIIWQEINDSIIYKQKFLGRVVVAKFTSGLISKEIKFEDVAKSVDKNKTEFAYIYFLPNGTLTPTSLQMTSKSAEDSSLLEANGPKFTLNINTLTGQTRLLEGFQNADFTPPKK